MEAGSHLFKYGRKENGQKKNEKIFHIAYDWYVYYKNKSNHQVFREGGQSQHIKHK